MYHRNHDDNEFLLWKQTILLKINKYGRNKGVVGGNRRGVINHHLVIPSIMNQEMQLLADHSLHTMATL
jgi:hypothetical protein